MKSIIRYSTICSILLFITGCNLVEHHALGPTETIADNKLPDDMFDPLSIKQSHAQTMVKWHLTENIENTKANPPDMLRGIAYLEYLLNSILDDYSIDIDTKKSVQKVVMTVRETLGIPIRLTPSSSIDILWSTAKFLEISNYKKIGLKKNEQDSLENISELKSAITGAVINTKLNIFYMENKKLIDKGGKPTFVTVFKVPAKQHLKNGLNKVSFNRMESKSRPKLSAEVSKELTEDLDAINDKIAEHKEFFLDNKGSYNSKIYSSIVAAVNPLEMKSMNQWQAIIRLQQLSDFLTICSSKMKQTLKITPKSKDEAIKIISRLEARDLSSIKQFLTYFKNNKKKQIEFLKASFSRDNKYLEVAASHLDNNGIKLDQLMENTDKISLGKLDELTSILRDSAVKFDNLSNTLNSVTKGINEDIDIQNLSDATRDLSFKVGELVASLNLDLQTVATNVSQAIQSGVSVNLEAMAQGMGFDSFAAAVAAYNAQYGTSFSVQQAKDALAGN